MIVEERARPQSPLRSFLVITTTIGLLGYMAVSAGIGSDTASIVQAGIVIGLLVYFLTLADVLLGLALMIAGIAMSPEFSVGGIDNLRLEDFVVPAVLLAWVGRVLRQRETPPPIQIGAPVLAYFGVVLLATVVGIAFHGTSAGLSLLVIGKLIEYFLIFAMIVFNVRTQEQFRALVTFSLLMALGSSLLSFGMGYQRLHGPSGETATIYGGFLVMHAAVALGLYVHARTGPARAGYAAVILVLSMGVLYTLSRTSYAALALGVAAFAVLKDRRLLVLLLIGVVLFLVLAPDSILRRASTLTSIFTEESTSSWAARVYAWKMILGDIRPSPLFGFGINSIDLGDVDNEYFRALHDTGILGLAMLVWLLVRIGRRANTTYESFDPGSHARGFAAGYLIAFFAVLVHCIGATTLTAIRTMEAFMVLTGLMVCLYNNRATWTERSTGVEGEWAAGLAEPPPR